MAGYKAELSSLGRRLHLKNDVSGGMPQVYSYKKQLKKARVCRVKNALVDYICVSWSGNSLGAPV